MVNKEALLGQKFGKLTPYECITKFSGGKQRTFCKCKCDCGNDVMVRLEHMTSGASKSCGCWNKERASIANKKENVYRVEGDIAIFTTRDGREFCVDASDIERISPITWWIAVNGYVVGDVPYNMTDGKPNQTVYLHRYLFGDIEQDKCVDHIDRNVLNNRRNNLRLCLHKDNSKNTSIRSDNTTGYTGVYRDKRNGRWFSEITADGEKHYLGTFKNIEDAIVARSDAEKRYFGEFAPIRSGAEFRW